MSCAPRKVRTTALQCTACRERKVIRAVRKSGTPFWRARGGGAEKRESVIGRGSTSMLSNLVTSNGVPHYSFPVFSLHMACLLDGRDLWNGQLPPAQFHRSAGKPLSVASAAGGVGKARGYRTGLILALGLLPPAYRCQLTYSTHSTDAG